MRRPAGRKGRMLLYRLGRFLQVVGMILLPVAIAEKEKMARAKPSEERWAEVVDELQAVLTSAGSDLVPAEDGRCVPVRWVCHARFAGLPKEVLARYRVRIERQAQQWLEQGRR